MESEMDKSTYPMEFYGELDDNAKKYLRGGVHLEDLKDKKLKRQLTVKEQIRGKAANVAAKAEKWLSPNEVGYLEAEGVEKTWRIRQESIAKEVDITSLRNQFDIKLPDLGPYTLNFTSSGRYMAIAGRKGHLALLDAKGLRLIKELQVRETVRDVTFMHNELFFATAQKKYPYIYDRDGVELHCLREHGVPLRLQFLKNHMLLASINKSGWLHYQDVTSGEMVANYYTRAVCSGAMQANPYNSVIALGHPQGTVDMWKPTSSAPLVKMLCHHGPISAVAFHPNGHIMATSGKERKIKVWDLRNFQPLQILNLEAKTLDFSQRGLLAAGTGSHLRVLKSSSETSKYEQYMSHSILKGYKINKVLFRPYEDVLLIGHAMGLSSILIPGSGEPNFDTWLANPFETRKQRQEKEIRSLLDKLPPETIMLDPTKIGTLAPAGNKKKPTKQEIESNMEEAVKSVKSAELKRKMKGKDKPSKRVKRKRDKLESVKKNYLEQQMKNDPDSVKQSPEPNGTATVPVALQRFVRGARI